jgi:hypothetical protein
MSNFKYFGLKGTFTMVKVIEWSPACLAKLKVYTIWVRIFWVPENMLHKEGFNEIVSMLEAIQEVDIVG